MSNSNIIIGVVVVALLAVGGWFMFTQQNQNGEAMMEEEGETMMVEDSNDAMMEVDAMVEGEAMMEDKEDGAMMEQ